MLGGRKESVVPRKSECVMSLFMFDLYMDKVVREANARVLA